MRPHLLAACIPAVLSFSLWGESLQDMEYAHPAGTSLTFDAWIPEGEGPFPAAILVHGGGFVSGNKQTVKPLFEPLTKAGFAWFSINYRLAPQFRYPAALEDVESAIRYFRSYARRYKIDLSRLTLIGESAGGYLVSKVGTENDPDLRLGAVVVFDGNQDLTRRATERTPAETVRRRAQFFGVSEATAESSPYLRSVSPFYNVRPGMPPYLLVHGTRDLQVDLDVSTQMCKRMKEMGNACDVFPVEGGATGLSTWTDPAWKQRLIGWLGQTLELQRPAVRGSSSVHGSIPAKREGYKLPRGGRRDHLPMGHRFTSAQSAFNASDLPYPKLARITRTLRR